MQADRPLLDRHIDPADPDLAVLVEALDLALAAEHERAGVRRVGQDVVHRAIARARPPDPPLPDRPSRQRLSLGGQLDHHLPRGPQPAPQAEHALDRVTHLLIGTQHNQVVIVAIKPDRQRQPQLAALGLVTQPADQPRADQVQLRLGDLTLEPQQQPIVEVLQVIDPVRVGDQRAGQRAQVKQPVPVRRAARQPRCLTRQDQPNVTEPDLGDQLLERQAPVAALTRSAGVLIDHRHRARRPTQLDRALGERVLQGGGLDVALDLTG